MAKGIRLFGWCFPSMGRDQHENCRVSYTYYDVGQTCECPCHTDPEWLDNKFTPQKPKRKKK